MKRVFPILLLIIFLSGIEWSYLWYSVMKNRMQAEFTEKKGSGFDKNDVMILKMPVGIESVFHWTEEGREFMYKGEMYDVAATKTRGNFNYYFCIKDTKEKVLLGILNNFSKDKSRSGKKLKSAPVIDNFIASIYLLSFTKQSSLVFAEYLYNYKSCIIQVNSPPPEC